MKHMIYKRRVKHDNIHSTWIEYRVNVEKVYWHDLKKDELVYVAGDLKDGEPTAMYGPHFVHDIDSHLLKNARGQSFYESFPYVFREVKE